MFFNAFSDERSFLVPEVVQTSAMDCGPAALKCLLEGFGVAVSYGRLREACQTDVDGTSIDTMEEVAVQLGLDAVQVMVPADHLLLPESQSLPAIVVVRLPDGMTHFVVAWRRHKYFVQVMDPGTGRRWMTHQRFLSDLYQHNQQVPADAWRDWAGSEGFIEPLSQRIQDLGVEAPTIARLIDTALADPNWYPLAVLDATTRMVDAIVRAGGLATGEEAGQVLERFFKRALTPGEGANIPLPYWSVQPQQPDPNNPEELYLLLKGAVLMQVFGRRETVQPTDDPEEAAAEAPEPLSPELMAALEEKPSHPGHEILRLLKEDGLLMPAVLVIALLIATLSVSIEALLFRGLLEIGQSLDMVGQRIGAVAALFIFLFGMLLLEFPITATLMRMARRLEVRLRVAFLEKIPRLGDRYFHSRLTSDMTQRAHELRQLRSLPGLGVSFLRLFFQIILTSAGVILLNPGSAPIAVLATIFAVGMTFATQPILIEQDLVLRTHAGALSRFYLDALLGLTPIRTHGAERAVRREHESLLVKWVHANLKFYRAHAGIDAISALGGAGFAVWILFDYIAKGGEASGVLLLFYWTLNLPALGQAMANVVQQYPMHRNRVLRLLEPLTAPEETDILDEDTSAAPSDTQSQSQQENASPPEMSHGVAITMENLSVHAGGHTILSNINLSIKAGEHLAVIGSSGAGKSSLVGILLGWHRPATGHVLVDGRSLTGQHLLDFRRETAWVDPQVQIWNRSLLDNLRYGSQMTNTSQMTTAIEQADLLSVLEKLPHGLQTTLGENGGLVSGGEGQRVRLGRAMLHAGARLVILDEPFRGLDREKRRTLLAQTREYWHEATLIFISHDVGETQTFERVLVIEEGQVIEDETPSTLFAQPESRYHALLKAEDAVRTGLWASGVWRRLWLEKGQLTEK
ncbi:MAG: ABC transporter permease [Candidatus Parabeggiatoa sp. nov. 1]|nr:MAG: ABC transporter permease [Gammaproteobacteria bacterium]HEC83628.1 ATP-binding cassette domain-containing protein [Thioploca sp.]